MLKLTACLATTLSFAACVDDPTNQDDFTPADNIVSYAPATRKALIGDFHAVGDGVADDTVALQNALNSAGDVCLDGQNHTFKVTDMVTATKSLCLMNATLVQAFVPVDTSPYITPSLPRTNVLTAYDMVDDPANRHVTGAEAAALVKSLQKRTLLVRPNSTTGAKPAVSLVNVHVVYGLHPEGGSHLSGSAGIYIVNADTVYFNRVECTGKGHGTCVHLEQVNNVELDNVNIHDMVWAPHAGDYPLIESEVRDFDVAHLQHSGWNSFPLYTYFQDSPDRPDGKFYQVRAQEQAFGMTLTDVTNCTINNLYLEGVLAQFDTGNLPVQGDGIDINGAGSNITIRNSMIQRAWEGIDVGGHPISNLTFDGVSMRDTWGFGYKVGYVTSNVVMKNATVDNSGIAGIVVYGADVNNITIDNIAIHDTGYVDTVVGGRYPWPYFTIGRAGVMLMLGASGVSISHTSAGYSKSPSMAPQYEFHNEIEGGGHNNTLSSSQGSGYSIAEQYGF